MPPADGSAQNSMREAPPVWALTADCGVKQAISRKGVMTAIL